MMFNKIKIALLLSISLLCNCQTHKTEQSQDTELPTWSIGPFYRLDSVNPILSPVREGVFTDPIVQQPILWQEKDVFNPAAIIMDDKVYLLYRAEDKIGKYNGTSRIGYAVSPDGIHFVRSRKPVFYPSEDSMKIFEWPGGCEDPRIVESTEGKYIMTYTAYDGTKARLCVAESNDLVNWQKAGPAFGRDSQKFLPMWSKSGSIICQWTGTKLVAVKIMGKYWMYWGDTDIFLASSDDLIHWAPVTDSAGNLKPVMKPRSGFFDSDLIEPGPPAMLTRNGILLIYNSRNSPLQGDQSLAAGTYSAGQALFDFSDPARMIKRLDKSFFKPEKAYEITGQVNNVCFLEGLAFYKGIYYLYYGTAVSSPLNSAN